MADWDPQKSFGARLARTLAEYTHGREGVEHVNRNAETYSWAVPFVGAGAVATLGHMASTAFDPPEKGKGGGSSWMSWMLPLGLIGGGIYAFDRWAPGLLKGGLYAGIKNPRLTYRVMNGTATPAEQLQYAQEISKETGKPVEDIIKGWEAAKASYKSGGLTGALGTIADLEKQQTTQNPSKELNLPLSAEEAKELNALAEYGPQLKDSTKFSTAWNKWGEATPWMSDHQRMTQAVYFGGMKPDTSKAEQLKAFRRLRNTSVYSKPTGKQQDMLKFTLAYKALTPEQRRAVDNRSWSALNNLADHSGLSLATMNDMSHDLGVMAKNNRHYLTLHGKYARSALQQEPPPIN